MGSLNYLIKRYIEALDGRIVYSLTQRIAYCPHPERGPKVKMTVCKTCQFHRSKRRGQPYNACQWKRDNSKLVPVNALVKDAFERAAEVLS